jgi:hypothetical protein
MKKFSKKKIEKGVFIALCRVVIINQKTINIPINDIDIIDAIKNWKFMVMNVVFKSFEMGMDGHVCISLEIAYNLIVLLIYVHTCHIG